MGVELSRQQTHPNASQHQKFNHKATSTDNIYETSSIILCKEITTVVACYWWGEAGVVDDGEGGAFDEPEPVSSFVADYDKRRCVMISEENW